MTNYLPPTRLFSPFNSPTPHTNHYSPPFSHPVSPAYGGQDESSSYYHPARHVSSSPFSSPSKSQSTAPSVSSPYRAPYESDSDDDQLVGEPAPTNLNTSSLAPTASASASPLPLPSPLRSSQRIRHVRLPPKSPNRFVAPDDSNEEGEEGEGREGLAEDASEFSEASLNMHGSFLASERYEDFEGGAGFHEGHHAHDPYPDHEAESSSSHVPSAVAPYPFSFSTYDHYLKSPLRSPLCSPSQWDDDDYRSFHDRGTIPPSPSHFDIVSPELHYLLDDLTISPKRSVPERTTIPTEAPTPAPGPTARSLVANYQAMSRAVQEESALELRHAIDESAVAVESLKLARKSQTYKNQTKLKEEDTKRESSYQKVMASIFNHKNQMERQIRERMEQEKQEQLRKQEAERKRVEDERLRLEALERQKKEEELQRKLEAERKIREEEERRKREEEERRRKEELERQRVEQERVQREEAERKRIEQENEKKRLEEEQERKRLEEEARKKEEEEKKKEEEAKKAEAQASVAAPSPVASSSTSTPVPSQPTPASEPTAALTEAQLEEKRKKKESKQFISPLAREEVLSLSRHYKTVLQSIQALDTNPAFKDTKRKATMDINMKIGQVCPDSAILNARTAELLKLCQDATIQGEPVHLFCLNIFAVKIMRQTALVEKPQSVFPVAIMTVSLLQKLPALEKILVAKFYEYCPFTVPRYVRRKPGQSDFDYKKSMGYMQVEDTPPKLEEDSAFFARMEGAVRLFAAIIQTPCSGIHPFGLSHGWTWLARMANLPPSDISATLLRVFLEIAGHELLKAYRIQFHKLLVYFAQEYVPKCPKTRPSDHDRLVKYLDSYLILG